MRGLLERASCAVCGDSQQFHMQVWFNDTNVGPYGMAEPVHGSNFLRVRPPVDPNEVDIWMDRTWFRRCGCGARLVPVERFHAVPAFDGSVWMRRKALMLVDRDAPDLLDRIDYVWQGTSSADADAYRAQSWSERTATIRALLAADDPKSDAVESAIKRVWVIGPTRCEACGDVRERCRPTLLLDGDDAFFDGWTPAPIYLGSRFAIDDAWLDRDESRPAHVRLRHPVGADELAVIDLHPAPQCGCTEDRLALVMRFRRTPGSLELVSLALRPIRDEADIADIDFAPVPMKVLSTSYPREVMRRVVVAAALATK